MKVVELKGAGLYTPELHGVTEIAIVDPDPEPTVVFHRLVNPVAPVSDEVFEFNFGIPRAEVADAPMLLDLMPEIQAACQGEVLAAHRATVTAGFLPELSGPWLCTEDLARVLLPEEASYSSQDLGSKFGIGAPSADTQRAVTDALVTAWILRVLRELALAEGFSEHPASLLELVWSPENYPLQRVS